MAAGSLLALLDDITTLLDDISTMTKIAARKTAGVLGDDLALNAEQVTGVRAERELPVVWAVTKGSLLNKLILVPIALLLSALAPWMITPLLMLGGAYLCIEGFEKIAHSTPHQPSEHEAPNPLLQAAHDPAINMVEFEKDKIKGAIRTDFILSAEIIVIALGTVKDSPFITQAAVVAAIAFIITIAVYGIVAAIVKLDDLGLYLLRNKASAFKQTLGRGILAFAPKLMQTLSIVGTAAMFLVGGSILLHGLPQSHNFLHGAELFVEQVGGIGGILAYLTPVLLTGAFGILAGGILLAIVSPVLTLIGKLRGAAA